MTLRLAGMASNRGRNRLQLAEQRHGGSTVPFVCTDDPSAPVLSEAEGWGIPITTGERDSNEGHREHDEVDAGGTITQQPVPGYPDYSLATLKSPIPNHGEFTAKPPSVRWLSEGRVTVDDDRNRVVIDSGPIVDWFDASGDHRLESVP